MPVVALAMLVACGSAATPTPFVLPSTSPPVQLPTSPTATSEPASTSSGKPAASPSPELAPSPSSPEPTPDVQPSQPGRGLAFTLQRDALPPGAVLQAPTDWSGGFFSLGKADPAAADTLWRSVDGSSWQSASLPVPSDQVLTILPIAGQLIAVSVDPGTGDRQVRLWTSTDGTDWSPSDGPLVPAVSGQTMTLSASAFGGDVVVFEHESSELCCGSRRSSAAAGAVGAGASPAPAGSPGSGSPEPAAATDWAWTQGSGSDWSRQAVAGSGGDLALVGAVAHDGLGIATRARGPSLIRSADGITWHAVAPLPPDADPTSPVLVAGLATGYVLAADTADARGHSGSHLTIWTAGPSGKWKAVLEQDGQTPESLAASGTTAVLGGNAIALLSPDGGASWSSIHHAGTGEPICNVKVAIHRSLVVAVDTCQNAGAGSTVLSLSLSGSASPP